MTAGEEITPSEVESKLENKLSEKGLIATPATTALTSKETELTKQTYRLQTWEKLENMDQVLFPRPCQNRIPRFKGENDAVTKMAELEAFKEAKVVKVNLDKAHERVRLEVIQNGKSLIAGTPGLKEAVFLLMRPPMEANKLANRLAASKMGIRHLGLALDFYSGTKADLVVLGSVAVDRKGHRIGKGEGFTDLEYALLRKLQIIEPETVIVTVVHDLQVYDAFPENLFKPWDVPIDIIVTPSQVIHVEKRLPRPQLTWSLLSNRRVNDIPIIKQLLEKDQLSGMKVELKEVDSETESTNNYYPPMRMNRRRFVRRRRLTSAPPDGAPRGAINRGSSAPPPRPGSRTFSQRNRRQTLPSNAYSSGDRVTKIDNKSGMGRRLGPPMRKIRRPRYTVDFSIKVDGLTTGVRIRELKDALYARNVRPIDISWRATKGVALLHFAKNRPNQIKNGIPEANMEDVVKLLQGLAIKTGDGNPTPELKVEGVKPIPRKSSSSVSDKETVPSGDAPNGLKEGCDSAESKNTIPEEKDIVSEKNVECESEGKKETEEKTGPTTEAFAPEVKEVPAPVTKEAPTPAVKEVAAPVAKEAPASGAKAAPASGAKETPAPTKGASAPTANLKESSHAPASPKTSQKLTEALAKKTADSPKKISSPSKSDSLKKSNDDTSSKKNITSVAGDSSPGKVKAGTKSPASVVA